MSLPSTVPFTSMFPSHDHRSQTVSGTLIASAGLNTSGNILVNGTVDGRDINADGTTLDNHVANASVHYAVGDINHSSIAGLTNDDHPQYLLSSTYLNTSGTFSSLSSLGDTAITVTPTEGQSLLWSDASGWIPRDHGNIFGLGDDDHPQYVLSSGARDIGGDQIVSGVLTASAGLNTSGNILVNGTVDGRDVAADGATLDNHVASASVHFTEDSIKKVFRPHWFIEDPTSTDKIGFFYTPSAVTVQAFKAVVT